MALHASGSPLHTRSLSVSLHAEEAGSVRVRGSVLDLRRRGFMPVPGGVQAPGPIHHMTLDARVEPETRRLASLAVAQPVVAFEPTPASRGECCRDPAPRLQALVGTRFDADYPRTLSERFGGPRGCSHLLTLAQLLGSAVTRALDAETARKRSAARAPGELIFQRLVTVDGFDRGPAEIQVLLRLCDVHTDPAADARSPLERLSRQLEIEALACVDRERLTLGALQAIQREGSRTAGGVSEWVDRSERVRPLRGRPVMGGLAREILVRLGPEAAERPLRDLLLNLAPAFIQCMAATLDGWMERAAAAHGAGGSGDLRDLAQAAIGGTGDSCYMWRREGALFEVRYQPGAARGAEPCSEAAPRESEPTS